MPCCPTRSSKSNPAARSTAITMFESLTDEGYIPCVSLLDFQKTGGKLDMTAYGRALDFGYKTYVLTTLYTSKTKCVFAGIPTLLGLRADLLDLPLSTSSCHFLLHSAEGCGVDDCGMIVLDIVFRALAVVDHDLL